MKKYKYLILIEMEIKNCKKFEWLDSITTKEEIEANKEFSEDDLDKIFKMRIEQSLKAFKDLGISKLKSAEIKKLF